MFYIFNYLELKIIGLFDKMGDQVVSYTYDTWGKLISTTGTLASTVGVKNPYRYRGYRYDTEISFASMSVWMKNIKWWEFRPFSTGP